MSVNAAALATGKKNRDKGGGASERAGLNRHRKRKFKWCCR